MWNESEISDLRSSPSGARRLPEADSEPKAHVRITEPVSRAEQQPDCTRHHMDSTATLSDSAYHLTRNRKCSCHFSLVSSLPLECGVAFPAMSAPRPRPSSYSSFPSTSPHPAPQRTLSAGSIPSDPSLSAGHEFVQSHSAVVAASVIGARRDSLLRLVSQRADELSTELQLTADLSVASHSFNGTLSEFEAGQAELTTAATLSSGSPELPTSIGRSIAFLLNQCSLRGERAEQLLNLSSLQSLLTAQAEEENMGLPNTAGAAESLADDAELDEERARWRTMLEADPEQQALWAALQLDSAHFDLPVFQSVDKATHEACLTDIANWTKHINRLRTSDDDNSDTRSLLDTVESVAEANQSYADCWNSLAPPLSLPVDAESLLAVPDELTLSYINSLGPQPVDSTHARWQWIDRWPPATPLDVWEPASAIDVDALPAGSAVSGVDPSSAAGSLLLYDLPSSMHGEAVQELQASLTATVRQLHAASSNAALSNLMAWQGDDRSSWKDAAVPPTYYVPILSNGANRHSRLLSPPLPLKTDWPATIGAALSPLGGSVMGSRLSDTLASTNVSTNSAGSSVVTNGTINDGVTSPRSTST